ncbi:DNA alkylation repair protein [Tropicibacter naphthalenivorans]|uniref:DNA alkylation repair enzyme n=1 Tax=Tropicibacter naphthalenivorans TaxID=441103 RepID=A0A0P1GXA1_9RHOB|nr:DNA alkylation repair protein [Tropicibacter naphthalenivorans]CUH80235.1 DNA alkylation repair enzyme [Tropicibacter naphthalenivorans]SMC85608.1 3-methyladenine DNA glycosylase AlkD [Tropicibacter naphthalenivorans]
MVTLEQALEALKAGGDASRAKGAAAYHKAKRVYLGVPNPVLNALTTEWRGALSVEDRVALANGLWQTDIFEARVAAAKLLTQARLRPDEDAWAVIQSWVPQFDSWAIADHVCSAGARRLQADPSRIDTVAEWTTSEHMWTRRAALVITLPWAKLNNPTEADLAIRDRVLGWAGEYVDDRAWFIQKAIAWWVRDLSKHDAPRAKAFLAAHGERLKAFARKEAAKYL